MKDAVYLQIGSRYIILPQESDAPSADRFTSSVMAMKPEESLQGLQGAHITAVQRGL